MNEKEGAFTVMCISALAACCVLSFCGHAIRRRPFHSPPEADPEDPIDFSSNPKSSSVSVGS